jgi:tetrahydrodipicolinate N-acetyltransferase
MKLVEIGPACRIAWNVTIMDHDFHTLYVDGTPKPTTLPVILGRCVWVGANTTILKGVTIGDFAVVAAGSIVTRSVPARALVAGNPARVIRTNIDFRG